MGKRRGNDRSEARQHETRHTLLQNRAHAPVATDRTSSTEGVKNALTQHTPGIIRFDKILCHACHALKVIAKEHSHGMILEE
jgi:hypothetical protein